MTRLLRVVVVLIVVAAAPVLFACEKCVKKGELDPNGGGPYSTAICWSGDIYQWSWCSGGILACTGGDPEDVCPVSGGANCGDHCVENPDSIVRRGPARECGNVDLAGRCHAGEEAALSFLN